MKLVMCQMQRFGSPSGCGTDMMTVASPARMVMKKVGNSTQPWLSLIWRVGETVHIETVAEQGVAGGRCSRVRPVTPSGNTRVPSAVRFVVDQFGEAGEHPHHSREGLGQLHDALDLFLRSHALDVRDLERGATATCVCPGSGSTWLAGR